MAVDSTKDQQDPLLTEAVKQWEIAQVLDLRAAWKGGPSSCHFVDLLKERLDLEQKLAELFDHKSQLVAAYSLHTLDLMDSKILERLPENILARKEGITSSTGSFRGHWELCAFARHVQKRWRERHKKSFSHKSNTPSSA